MLKNTINMIKHIKKIAILTVLLNSFVVHTHSYALTSNETSSEISREFNEKIPLILKKVSLSSNGTGYFEYEAQVTGNATLSLPVALDKVDDVLKSLVVYDAKGRIGGMRLPGLNPIEQTLKQLPFDATALEATEKLLESLRGAEITLMGKTHMRGRIVAVKLIEATEKESAKHQITLMTDQGLQTFILEQADTIQFVDEELRNQIKHTLIALEKNRAKDTRVIEIMTQGNTPRRVRVGYVSSVPIWKNAYRLIVPATQADNADIQGWAIIENMSGQDWKQVQLTLTSGKAVSFSQPLYQSYYNTRPHLGVELPNQMIPVADSGTFDGLNILNNPVQAYTALSNEPPTLALAAPAPKLLKSAAKMLANNSEQAIQTVVEDRATPTELTVANDIALIQDNITHTQYTFEMPVSVGSGQSLSIPIIQHHLPINRMALYQPITHAQFPLAAIELNNTTANTLPAGAVTVYEAAMHGNQLLGDAQLKVLPSQDKRYLAYALDQKIVINQRNDTAYNVKQYVIKGAYLHTDYAQEQTAVFTIKSNHNEPYPVYVEVPIQAKDWQLLDDIKHHSMGKTATHYRQKIMALPQKTIEVPIRQTRQYSDVQALGDLNSIALRDILNKVQHPVNPSSHTIALSSQSKAILERIISLMETRDHLIQKESDIKLELQSVRDNQQRIRDNLKSVPVKSEPHVRYMNELNKADMQDSRLQTELSTNQLNQQLQKKELQAYLNSLN